MIGELEKVCDIERIIGRVAVNRANPRDLAGLGKCLCELATDGGLLERPEVQAVAGDIGLDLRRAQSAVSTLDAQQLSTIAAQASQVEQALAGGQSSITISTTLIIIGLLVLILIVIIA